MATVLITGGTGLIGKTLGQALQEKGYRVIILSRQANRHSTNANLSYAHWSVEEKTIDKEAISKADFIIHLAGAGVADKRWTKKRKQEIVSSRTNSSKLIIESLGIIPNKVKAVISASGIGWYLTPNSSPPGGEDLTPDPSPQKGEGGGVRKLVETDPVAYDFLGQTCKKWEESIEPVTLLGKRLVKLRIGIVLSKNGGALREFLKPLKFGVAAILGKGKQIISWIHIDDLVSLFIKAIEDDKMNGVFNAVAPRPVSNKELMLELAKSRHHFFIPIHIPSFILKMVLGEMSTEVLKSATVSCDKVLKTGFIFQFPDIYSALTDLVKKDDHPVN
jgi:NAD dependent epimerase/dehydratase family enzyme